MSKAANRSLKKLLVVVLSILALPILVVLFLYLSEWLFPSFWGSYKLGNGLFMMDWDGNYRIIVYNPNPSGNTCYSGAYIIPDKNSHCSTDRSLGVIDAKSDKKWVAVIAFEGESHQDTCYFLIDKSFDVDGLDWQKDKCDSIIQSHIIRYDAKQSFYEKLDKIGFKKRI
ncbi:hypothetical protein [Bacteroides heparinolyticus]|uniref:hypothetical protein n=1 Tax=Prevotella heparinolytica TaxID=28113 RepID=UPI0035A15ADC